MLNHRVTATGRAGALLAAVAATLLLACAEPGRQGPRAGTYDGPAQAIGGGTGQVFVSLDASGLPTAIGVRLSEAALAGLPTEPPPDADGWEYLLTLPKEAEGSGYDHIGIDWNPKGHIPPGIYDAPHFDFHFYLISPGQRNRITATGEDLARLRRAPAPEFMPEGYVLPEGTEVPRMGAHAIDPAAPEFNKQPFTTTFIYGFYDGQVVFLEPMMTKAFLETKPNVIEQVRLPKHFVLPAYYPATYRVKYDAARREYVISLESLVSR